MNSPRHLLGSTPLSILIGLIGCLIVPTLVTAVTQDEAASVRGRPHATAPLIAADDSNGLPPTYIYFKTASDGDTFDTLYRITKSGGHIRPQRILHLLPTRRADRIALDPTGRWLLHVVPESSVIRKLDIVTGEYVDHHTNRMPSRNVGCDSQYVYEFVGHYAYRYRFDDLSFVDSTKIDQEVATLMFGITNDSVWVGDTLTVGFYVYPLSAIKGDSARFSRYQYVGHCGPSQAAWEWMDPAWDGHYYYLGSSAAENANPFRRYSHDWQSYEELILPYELLSTMALTRPPFYARDVGPIETRCSELLPRGLPATVRALIGNFGNQAQGPFDVAIQLGSQRSRKTVPHLDPGDTLEVTFDPFTPESSGFFTLRCSTALAADQDTSNDVDTFPLAVTDFTETFDSTSGRFAADPAGNWAWGAPVAPRPPAHSGDKVWGNALEGDYANIQDSRLISPGFTATQDQPIIAFYQWYSIDPHGDGGNFSYKIDTLWSVLDPWQTRAYTGWIPWMHANGYCSDLFAWEKAAFKIPVSEGTPFFVSWRLGADSSRTSSGWIIDDVAGLGCVPNGQGIAEQSKQAGATLSISPTLVRKAASIRYSLPKDGPVNLKLYDVTGRLARTLAAGQRKAAGVYIVPLNAAGLARGVYILRFEAGSRRLTQKLVIE